MRRGRAGRACNHLVDPDGEPVAADGCDRQRWHRHRRDEEECENFHAAAARALAHVIVSDRHVSLSKVFED